MNKAFLCFLENGLLFNTDFEFYKLSISSTKETYL